MSQLLSFIKVSRMNAGWNTPKKRQSPQRNPKVQMRVFFVTWVLKFQSVISAEKNKYILTEIYLRFLKVELTKFAYQVLKIHVVLKWIHKKENLNDVSLFFKSTKEEVKLCGLRGSTRMKILLMILFF